jgi:hypothetical protein
MPQWAKDYAKAYAVTPNTTQFCAYPDCDTPGTDCANFVAQALLAGNHPLSYPGGLDAFDSSNSANFACSVTKWGSDRNVCVGTRVWRDANVLRNYLTDIIDGNRPVVEVAKNDLNFLTIVDEDPAARASVTAFGRELQAKGIDVGDVLWINSSPPHVAIIVGWGDAVASRAQLSVVEDEYRDEFVPYIVDHGSEPSNPRPFYFLRLPSENSFGTSEWTGENFSIPVYQWAFIKMPPFTCILAEDYIPSPNPGDLRP